MKSTSSFFSRPKIKGSNALATLKVNLRGDFITRVKLRMVKTVYDLCQPSMFTTFPVKPGSSFFIALQPQTWKWSKPRAKPTQAIFPRGALGKRSSVIAPMETLRSKHGESNGNVVKAVGLRPMSVTQDDLQKTRSQQYLQRSVANANYCCQSSRYSEPTTLHGHPTFCLFLCSHCTITTWNFHISRFKQQDDFLSQLL